MEVIRILDQLLENLEQELRLRNTKCIRETQTQKYNGAIIFSDNEIRSLCRYVGLEKACEKAMNQIRELRYDERLRNEDRNDILAYGIAFCKKKCKVVVENL